jgi:hypothetical protein
MHHILTAAQQEARLLKDELKALDDHDAETQRLIRDAPAAALLHPGAWAAREDTRRDMSARVVERARRLAKLVDP